MVWDPSDSTPWTAVASPSYLRQPRRFRRGNSILPLASVLTMVCMYCDRVLTCQHVFLCQFRSNTHTWNANPAFAVEQKGY